MSKAPVSVAIIARNAAKTIGACLDSIVPFVEEVVVCVDETTDDKTAAVSLAHGAKVVTGHVVSEWHECPHHGRVLAQNFGKARDVAFAKLRPDTPWLMWIDSDDVFIGGEKIKPFLESLPEECTGVWLPYQYSSTPNGQPSTLFDRERLLRRSEGWHWEHRVHEIAVPNTRSSEEIIWIRTDEMLVLHQEKGHDNNASANRNILILEIELEERPGDSWALQYLGNQYFALGDWERAIGFFEASLNTDNLYQKWLTHVYRSVAYENVNDLNNSRDAAFDAIILHPGHPEPYYRLATLSMLRGNVEHCEIYTKIADSMPPTPSVVFKNPMDKLYNARVTLGQAYLNHGDISKAKRQYEEAAKVIPNEVIEDGIKQCTTIEEEILAANKVVDVVKNVADRDLRNIFTTDLTGSMLMMRPGPEVWKFGRVRDIVAPALLRTRPTSDPRIVFWCGRSAESWAPPSINTTGIGGSETAVIEIAKRFQNAGFRVDVYNHPDRFEGEYDGVGYWGLDRLRSGEHTEVLVSWRNPSAYDLPIERRVSLLWMHDLNSGPGVGRQMERWDRTLGVSDWHARYLAQMYELTNTGFVPNGIDLARFVTPEKKTPFRCVYASSPDRGLARLLQMWPAILKNEPEAELHVGYGWETIDRYIQMGNTNLLDLKQEITELIKNTPRVVWRGRLPQDELAKLYKESYLWLYPTSFTEVSCITAMETMAGGCVPVTSGVGALPETIGDGGLVVTGNTYTPAWKDFYLLCVRAAMTSVDLRHKHMTAGYARAEAQTWDKSYDKWRLIVDDLLYAKEEKA